MRTKVVGLLALAVMVGSASPLAAQREIRRSGFWIGFGIGGGWSQVVDSGLDPQPGGAGYLRLGWTLNERLLLGGEIGLWARDDEPATLARSNAVVALLFYPSRSGGFFLKGGVGASAESREATTGSTTVTVSQSGTGVTLGLGYDIRLGRRFSLTPNLDIQAQDFENRNTDALVLMLGLSWH